MKKAFATTAIHKWQRYSGNEKATILYVLVLFILFLLAPLIKIDQINSTTTEIFRLMNSSMTKTFLTVLLCGLFLIGRNSSYRRKNRLHKSFGYTGSTSMTNAVVFFIILLMLFSMGDTVALLSENFNNRIDATNRFLIIGIYLIAGIAWQLIETRLHRKKQGMAENITIKKELDESKKEQEFQQMEKEFQGLFENEKMNTEE